MGKSIDKIVKFSLCAFMVVSVIPRSHAFQLDYIKETGGGLLFQRNHVTRIEISISPEDLEEIYASPENKETKKITALFIYKNRTDTLQNIGIRIKGNASVNNPKKSFKLEFNEFEKGRKYEGLEKLNLNADWNDPSHIRSYLSIELYSHLGVNVGRAGFADLYFNGKFYGLYTLNEQVDEEFTKRVLKSGKGNLYKGFTVADLSYIDSDPYSYHPSDSSIYKYELKTNKKEYDYSGLAELIDIINNTSETEFENKINSRFNMEAFIKAMAVTVAIGNWDSYLGSSNNYYLYDDPKSGKFEFIPYDFDNTFGIDWIGYDWAHTSLYDWRNFTDHYLYSDTTIYGGDELVKFQLNLNSYIKNSIHSPLYGKMVTNPKFRNQYSYQVYEIYTYMSGSNFSHMIDELIALLKPSLQKDSLDNFSWNEIETSLNESIDSKIDFLETHFNSLPYGLKEFIDLSLKNISSQIEQFSELSPVEKPTQKRNLFRKLFRSSH